MACLPHAVDKNRTVIETIPVQTRGDWWTGLVRDRDEESGEMRLRLERLVENDTDVEMPHVWRVRPDFWKEERKAVSKLENGDGSAPPGNLPISNYFTPQEYVPIRTDDVRRVAAVQLRKPSGSQLTRLYHWDADDDGVRQKFTTGQPWSDLVRRANTQLRT